MFRLFKCWFCNHCEAQIQCILEKVDKIMGKLEDTEAKLDEMATELDTVKTGVGSALTLLAQQKEEIAALKKIIEDGQVDQATLDRVLEKANSVDAKADELVATLNPPVPASEGPVA